MTGQPGAPRVSVITAVLNGAATLPGLIDSVVAQDYPALEFIVVDGGSTDGTNELLATRDRQIDQVICGPDSGIAEAMNKGLARASGDWVLFLHADDRFADPQALSRAMTQVQDPRAVQAFPVYFGEGPGARLLRPRPFNFWTYFKNPLPHQGVLCPRELLVRLGGFDQDLRISMDYDFFLRACRAGIRLERHPGVLAVMGDGGLSSRRDWPGLAARFAEERQIHRRHAHGLVMAIAYRVYWPLYLAYRRLRNLWGRDG